MVLERVVPRPRQRNIYCLLKAHSWLMIFLSVCLHLLDEAREFSGAPFIDTVAVEWRIFLAGSYI